MTALDYDGTCASHPVSAVVNSSNQPQCCCNARSTMNVTCTTKCKQRAGHADAAHRRCRRWMLALCPSPCRNYKTSSLSSTVCHLTRWLARSLTTPTFSSSPARQNAHSARTTIWKWCGASIATAMTVTDQRSWNEIGSASEAECGRVDGASSRRRSNSVERRGAFHMLDTWPVTWW